MTVVLDTIPKFTPGTIKVGSSVRLEPGGYAGQVDKIVIKPDVLLIYTTLDGLTRFPLFTSARVCTDGILLTSPSGGTTGVSADPFIPISRVTYALPSTRCLEAATNKASW